MQPAGACETCVHCSHLNRCELINDTGDIVVRLEIHLAENRHHGAIETIYLQPNQVLHRTRCLISFDDNDASQEGKSTEWIKTFKDHYIQSMAQRDAPFHVRKDGSRQNGAGASTPHAKQQPGATFLPAGLKGTNVMKPKSDQDKKERKSNLPWGLVQQHFDLPINVAAKQLGVCATVLKKICRKHGLQRWPFRKIKCLGSEA